MTGKNKRIPRLLRALQRLRTDQRAFFNRQPAQTKNYNRVCEEAAALERRLRAAGVEGLP